MRRAALESISLLRPCALPWLRECVAMLPGAGAFPRRPPDGWYPDGDGVLHRCPPVLSGTSAPSCDYPTVLSGTSPAYNVPAMAPATPSSPTSASSAEDHPCRGVGYWQSEYNRLLTLNNANIRKIYRLEDKLDERTRREQDRRAALQTQLEQQQDDVNFMCARNRLIQFFCCFGLNQ